MATLFLREDEVKPLLTMREAVEAVEEACWLQGLGSAIARPRQRLRTGRGHFNVMPASAPPLGVTGWKAYGNGAPMRDFLFSTETGEFLAIVEGNWLGAMRTGAATGVATKYQARADAATLGIYGTGRQARTQLEAVCAVRSIKEVRAYSRTSDGRERFAEEMSRRLGVPVRPVPEPEDAARGCDTVVVITNASQPVLKGEWLEPGTHVNAAGANGLLRQELDPQAVVRAAIITADSLEQARMESADLLWAVERGLIGWEQVMELGQVVCGRAPGRTSDDQITLFESLGLGLWDLAVANVVYRKAKEQGVGTELPL